MAATLTSAGELTFISFPITKFEETGDGNLYVYGKATDGSVDSDEQIVDTEFSGKAIANWLATGANVRVQHNAQRDPAGVGVEVSTESDGSTWVKSLVVETEAKNLVRHKALRAYSVGIARPKIVRDNVARNGRIVDGEIVEISLVDRPANKNCGIQLVKADKDGNVEFSGKVFGAADVLTKGASATVEITTPVNPAFSPADLAKLLHHRATAEKRQMDANVGGGVDRDKIPGSDFAGRDRSFPIVTPGDVSDAASSIGRAGADNYSSDQLRANISRIAHRKGPEFVAALPESWKSEMEAVVAKGDGAVVEDDNDDNEGGEVKAADTGKDGEENVAEPDETKGAKGGKTCTGCGKGFDSDSKLRSCPGCGKALPKSGGQDKEDLEKGHGGCSCGGGSCDGCGNCAGDCDKCMGMKTDKSVSCPGCSQAVTTKFCGGCGHQVITVEKNDTPGAGVVGVGASNVEPVPAHREPDGTDIEALEADASMPTTPDASVKAAQRLKSVGVPSDMGVIHDLTCAAFDPVEVAKTYPNENLHTIDVDAWQQKALDAAANSPLAEAQKMTELWQHVITLKGADHEMLDEVREESHKSFQDANPGPGTFPTPTELSPVRFRRPVLTAGQASHGTGYDGPNTAQVPTDGVTADDFNRGPLTDGQAAQSPSNKGRSFYRNVQRDSARSALAAMHDHIAQTFPDLCSMHEDHHPGAGPDANAPATHVGKSVEAPVESVVEPTTTVTPEPAAEPVAEVKKSKKDKKMVTKAATVDADLIKSAVIDALTPLATQVEELTKALKDEQAKNVELAKTVDELSNLPDPTVAAFKGVAAPDALKSSTSVASTVASAAERTQAALMAALTEDARHSPDPSEREAAWTKLYQMSGIQ
jgi:Caudovirus prohead protease.